MPKTNLFFSFCSSTSEIRQSSSLTKTDLLENKQTIISKKIILEQTLCYEKVSYQSIQQMVKSARLDTRTERLFSIFTKKMASQINSEMSCSYRKEILLNQLQTFQLKLNPKDPTFILSSQLAHDLKNMSLVAFNQKYYQTMPIQEDIAGTVLENLKSFILLCNTSDEISDIRQKILADCQPKATNRDEMMCLLAHKQKERNPGFNGFVIDLRDLSSLATELNKLNASHFVPRTQLMIRSDVHYTAVDLEMVNGVWNIAVMDAAGNAALKEIAEIFAILPGNHYVLGTIDSIQFDTYNCAFFCYDSLIQSSKQPNFFDMLAALAPQDQENSPFTQIPWKNMPPIFIRNATSLTFMNDYIKKNALALEAYKSSRSFAEFIEKNKGSREIKGELRNYHNVLDNKITKLQNKIVCSLSSLDNNALQNSLESHNINQLLKDVENIRKIDNLMTDSS